MGPLRRHIPALALLLIAALAGGVTEARAQVAAGALTGFVRDPAGAGVPGATVTVTQVTTKISRVVVTKRDGVFTTPSLASG